MHEFAELYRALDETTKTSLKVAAMVRYFRRASAAEAAWAVYFLIGRKPRQIVPVRQLCDWACEVSGVPQWLFGESYDAVGDLAETIALLLPTSQAAAAALLPLDDWVEKRLLPLRDLEVTRQREGVLQAWRDLDAHQAFVWNKLITAGFRVGVSQQLVIRALAEVSGLDAPTIAHRMMGEWSPTAAFFQMLVGQEAGDSDASRPYPFFLAHPLEGDVAGLGDLADWQTEWKWDGIRAQLVRRGGRVFLWSRGEELVTDRFPEIVEAALQLPSGVVLDGEILPCKGGEVLPFQMLQKRIGRKTLSKRLLEEVPVVLMTFDLLEAGGQDVRGEPLHKRRQRLTDLLAQTGDPRLRTSPVLTASMWQELTLQRTQSRELKVEGLMLKRRDSPYGVGRQRGDWWKWKIEPYTVDAVLIYAQRGSGKRASLYTDYTFGVWDKGTLVPVAKAYSGLTDAQILQVDAFIRLHTLERFGPVRTVKPELVFELAFEAIQASTRHKAGVAVRFPRMLRWRTDKRPEDADTLERLRALVRVG
jgi:DNA ligase-1